jgi:DNA-binding CsgD family transcriptional regulator
MKDPSRSRTFQRNEPKHVRGPCLDLLTVLDLLNLGILVVNSEGRITFANRAADDLLERRRGREGSESGVALDQIRAAMSCSDSGDGCVAFSTANRKSLVVLIIPFHDNDPSAGVSTSILFISDPTAEPALDLRPITRLYGLTRAETQLLHALASGERVGVYVKRAGITLNTAKGYLKQLFSKTQTHRQSDLIRLVLGNPLLRLVSAKPKLGERQEEGRR